MFVARVWRAPPIVLVRRLSRFREWKLYGNTSDTRVTRMMEHRWCHANKTIMRSTATNSPPRKFSDVFALLWFAEKEKKTFTCCTLRFRGQRDSKHNMHEEAENEKCYVEEVKKKNWHRAAKDHRDKRAKPKPFRMFTIYTRLGVINKRTVWGDDGSEKTNRLRQNSISTWANLAREAEPRFRLMDLLFIRLRIIKTKQTRKQRNCMSSKRAERKLFLLSL